MRPYFIVNPVAGGGAAMDKFKIVKQFLNDKGVEFGCVFTERANQSTELAEEAYANGERFIVSVGGDGTLSEIASALYKYDDAVMGLCPFGTGNDFARAVSMPTDPVKAAEVMIGGAPRPVDIGMAGDKPFINVGGLGFDVDVVINTEKYKGRFRGMLPYLIGIFKSLFPLNKVPVRLVADGKVIDETVLLLSVGNGSHFGGGIAVCPEADPFDGYFDVCVVRKVSLFRFLTLFPLYVKGRHLGKKPVLYFKAKEVSIECEKAPMQLDGELGESAPTTFKLLPGALRLMLPLKG